jgi:hypothetical protein
MTYDYLSGINPDIEPFEYAISDKNPEESIILWPHDEVTGLE